MIAADVPVVACSTNYGSGERQKPTKATERLRLPASAASRLAVFATNVDRVLAPREWRCTAEVGANGTARLTVSPESGDRFSILADDAAATYGDILDLACSLFEKAAKLQKQDLGVTCLKRDPAAIVRRVGATVAWFEDPPGVAGTGAQSGGDDAAMGAVYYIGGQEPTATKVTCVLSREDRGLCTAVIDDWLRRSGTGR
jgi:hypothetical protein